MPAPCRAVRAADKTIDMESSASARFHCKQKLELQTISGKKETEHTTETESPFGVFGQSCMLRKRYIWQNVAGKKG
jgi:hypothetical protein